MSTKDHIASGMIESVLKMLPTEYEIQNPVSQFLCDAIDKVLADSKLTNIIKAQAVQKANADPNGVLDQLVAVYNDRVLIGFHIDIGDFVKELNDNETESVTEEITEEIDDE